MVGDIISVMNIIIIAAAICAVVTWGPSAKKFLTSARRSQWPSRIYWLAAGIVTVAMGVIFVRLYSFGLREYDLLWLRETSVPVAAVGLQMIGFLILAYAYFAPTKQRDLTPDNYHGLWAGGVALISLSLVKMIF